MLPIRDHVCHLVVHGDPTRGPKPDMNPWWRPMWPCVRMRNRGSKANNRTDLWPPARAPSVASRTIDQATSGNDVTAGAYGQWRLPVGLAVGFCRPLWMVASCFGYGRSCSARAQSDNIAWGLSWDCSCPFRR